MVKMVVVQMCENSERRLFVVDRDVHLTSRVKQLSPLPRRLEIREGHVLADYAALQQRG